MAYISNTAFEPRITNNEFNELCNVTGKYVSDSADLTSFDTCSAGFLVKRVSQLPCEGFTGVNNENAWYMAAAASTDNADEVIYACNTYDVQLLSDGDGNIYAVGARTLGLAIPSGRYGNYTVIEFDGQHVYRFGIGNLSAALSTNTFFTIANGLLVPAASAPATAGSIYFELRGTGTFTEGTQDSFGYVDVVAKKVTA